MRDAISLTWLTSFVSTECFRDIKHSLRTEPYSIHRSTFDQRYENTFFLPHYLLLCVKLGFVLLIWPRTCISECCRLYLILQSWIVSLKSFLFVVPQFVFEPLFFFASRTLISCMLSGTEIRKKGHQGSSSLAAVGTAKTIIRSGACVKNVRSSLECREFFKTHFHNLPSRKLR